MRIASVLVGAHFGVLLMAADVRPRSAAPRPVFPKSATSAAVAELHGRLPLHFEPNRGQTDARVQYLSRGDGMNIYLTGTEAVFVPHGDKPAVVRMKLAGSRKSAIAEGVDKLEGISNYFLGRDPSKWVTDIPQYRRVAFRDVYPGVDVVYYGNQRRLEYDLVVAPGADPGVIDLTFEGVDSIRRNAGGDLLLRTPAGELTQRAPVVYQEVDGVRVGVEAQYRVRGRKVGVTLARYDRSRELVIDPVIVYSTYLGGSGSDRGLGIAVDATGAVYVVGNTASANFPVANAFRASNAGSDDVFVAKLNPSGTALGYSTYIGGAALDNADEIALDATNAAYVLGRTRSANFPVVNPYQGALGGFQDVFVLRLAPAGNALSYSTYLGGSGVDTFAGLAIDSAGAAYVAGQTTSIDFPTVNGFQAANGGGGLDGFVSKLSPSGSTLVYSTYIGGSGGDSPQGLALGGGGAIYVAGSTTSLNFPTANAFQSSNAGGLRDGFVMALNAAGSALVFSTYIGGSGDDLLNGIAVDGSGVASVTGFTDSFDFPTVRPYQAFYAGGRDAVFVRIDSSGRVTYSSYLGGSGNDFGLAIALDSNGMAYLQGGPHRPTSLCWPPCSRPTAARRTCSSPNSAPAAPTCCFPLISEGPAARTGAGSRWTPPGGFTRAAKPAPRISRSSTRSRARMRAVWTLSSSS